MEKKELTLAEAAILCIDQTITKLTLLSDTQKVAAITSILKVYNEEKKKQ